MFPRKTSLTRRRFLAAAAGGAAGLQILSSSRLARAYQANERLRLAVFGNMYNAAHFLTAAHIYNADIVALCNPDQRKIPGIVKQWQERADQLQNSTQADQQQAAARYRRMAQGEGVTIFSDVRRLFGEMADGITITFTESPVGRPSAPANRFAASVRWV